MGKRMKIYVSGPISNGETIEFADREPLVEEAIDYGAEIKRKGHYPYIPHYTYYMEKRGHNFSYEEWMEEDFVWLALCDAIFRTPRESVGADSEIHFATEQDKLIYYHIEDIPNET